MAHGEPTLQPLTHVVVDHERYRNGVSPSMSVFVWVMIGVALWHFAVLVPDHFYGGIIGALVAAVGGALVSGYLLPSPGIPPHNPPGLAEALWPIPGSLLALLATYGYGGRRERSEQFICRG